MKKLILSLLILFAANFIYAQGFPNYQPIGSPTTRTDILGAAEASKGLIITPYSDTTTANLGYIDAYPGAFIVTGNTLWQRNSNATAWLAIGYGNANSSTTNISILNDSTVIICNGLNVCDTISISTNITDLSTVYFLTDSSIVICDSLANCDTITINHQQLYVFQNGVNSPFPGIVEFGGNLVHNTTLTTDYQVMYFHGYPVYNYPYQFSQGQIFNIGTGITSFKGYEAIRLGINYTGDTAFTNPTFYEGFFGDHAGFWIGPNLTGGVATGAPNIFLNVDDPSSKYSGIFFHTSDTDYTDAWTLYGAPAPNTSTVINLDTTKILTGHTNKDLQAWGYPNTRDDGTNPQAGYGLYVDGNGYLKYGDLGGGGGGGSNTDSLFGVQDNRSFGDRYFSLRNVDDFVIDSIAYFELDAPNATFRSYYTLSPSGGHYFIAENSSTPGLYGNVGVENTASYVELISPRGTTGLYNSDDGVKAISLLAVGNPYHGYYHTSQNNGEIYIGQGITLNNTALHGVRILHDSLTFQPAFGNINIDTLRSAVNQNTLIAWTQGTGQGPVGYVTIGSGLSLSGGTLNATGGSNTDSLFGVQDNIATADRFFNGSSFNFRQDSIGFYRLHTADGMRLTRGNSGAGTGYRQSLYMTDGLVEIVSDGDDAATDGISAVQLYNTDLQIYSDNSTFGSDLYIHLWNQQHLIDFNARNINTGAASLFKLRADSIQLLPNAGRINIDTLRAAVNENTLIGWTQGTGQGPVGYVTIGSGLSLSGGTLSLTGGSNPAWELDGNAATSGASTGDFLGTTNNTTLRIRTNNVERMTIDSTGNVGINTIAPGYDFHFTSNTLGLANSAVFNLNDNNLFTVSWLSSTGSISYFHDGTGTAIWGMGEAFTVVARSTDLILSGEGAGDLVYVKPEGTYTTIFKSTHTESSVPIGIGITGPTAKLHIAAGTASANTSPIKLTTASAALLTTPEAGAIEVLLDSAYYTASDGIRRRLAYAKEIGRFQFDKGSDIVAANNLELGGDGNMFAVTGNTQINAIGVTNWQAGATVSIVCTGAPLFKNNTAGGAGTAPLLLAGRVDFQAAAGDYIAFQYDGTNWYETNRKLASTGGTYTFNNGLTESPPGTVRLGGTLLVNTTIATAAQTLTVSTATGAINPLAVTSTTGNAIEANATSGVAIRGINTGATEAIFAIKNSTVTNTLISTLAINRQVSGGVGAAGAGASLDYYVEVDDGSSPNVARIAGVTTNAAAASYSGKLDFYTTNTTSSALRMTLDERGSLILTGRLQKDQGADVASVAGAITLGTDGNVFEITGTNAITLISNVNWQNGSEVTLIFTSTASLTDGTANSGTNIGMELAGGANFSASADDVIVLVLSEVGGTQRWREKSRSVN